MLSIIENDKYHQYMPPSQYSIKAEPEQEVSWIVINLLLVGPCYINT